MDWAPACTACERVLATMTITDPSTDERIPLCTSCSRMFKVFARILGVETKRRPALRVLR